MRTPALGCMLIPGPHHAMSNATRLIRQRRQGGPMDTDRIANLLRALRTSPSRRAVTTAVVALAVSTPLAPLFGHEPAEAKGKGKKKKKKHDPKTLVPE